MDMTKTLSDPFLWLAVISGFISGWLCLFIAQQVLRVVQMIRKKTKIIFKIVDPLLRLMLIPLAFCFVTLVPAFLLPGGSIYRLYIVCYLFTYAIGALSRIPKFRIWIKLNENHL